MPTYEITYVRKLVKDGSAAEQIDKPEKAVDYFRMLIKAAQGRATHEKN